MHAFITVLSLLYELNMQYLYVLDVATLLLIIAPPPHVFFLRIQYFGNISYFYGTSTVIKFFVN